MSIGELRDIYREGADAESMGWQGIRDEIHYRHQERISENMSEMTNQMKEMTGQVRSMTVAIIILTIINVGLVAYQVLWSSGAP